MRRVALASKWVRDKEGPDWPAPPVPAVPVASAVEAATSPATQILPTPAVSLADSIDAAPPALVSVGLPPVLGVGMPH